MSVNKKEAFRDGSGNSLMRKLLPILAVIMVIASGAAFLNNSDSYSEGAGDAETHDVVYHPYFGDKPALGTYNDLSAGDVSVKCYGSIVSTEYNPQVWKGTGPNKEITSNWYAPNSYVAGKTTVFAGWTYATAFSGNSASSVSDNHFPGEVLSKAEMEAATGPDGKIHIYATWAKVENVVYASSTGYWGSDGTNASYPTTYGRAMELFSTGVVYTNMLLLVSGGNIVMTTSMNTGAVTIRSADLNNKATLTLGSNAVSIGNQMFIDNVRFTGYFISDNHGYDDKGLFANGNVLIMGTGIDSQRHSSAGIDFRGFPQLFGGSQSSTISSVCETIMPYGSEVNVDFSAFMIVHSGIYGNVVAGGRGDTLEKSAYLVVKDVTILDSLLGGPSKGTMRGDAYVYTTAANMPGDTFEETQMGSDDIPAGLSLRESTIFTGGSGTGTVGDTHVFVSGTSRMWDVQGGGRAGNSTAQDTNVEISGKALIKHVVCGSITDGNSDSHDRPAVRSTNITVKDEAKVGAVYGAGYDTFYEAKYVTMMGAGSSISVDIRGGTVGYVYGGGYRGTVGTTSAPLDSVSIRVEGGTVLGDVFGGGRGGLDKLCHEPDGSYNWGSSQNDTTGRSLVYAKNVSVVISGGTVGGNVYGGGESVPVISSYDGTTQVGPKSIGSPKSFPSGLGVASVICNGLSVNIEGNVLGDVFLGGKGVDLADMDEKGRHSSAYNYVMKADGSIGKVPWIKGSGATGTSLTSVDYTNYASIQAKSAQLLIDSAVIGDTSAQSHVYGGGERGVMSVEGDVMVKLRNSVVHGSVYGAGKGDEDKEADGRLTAPNVVTTIVGATVDGDLYGGGAYGEVVGSTAVTIDGGSRIGGSVYGAGLGKVGRTSVTADSSITLKNGIVAGDMYGGAAYGLVEGNSSAVLNGGTVGGNLYGGGLGVLDNDSVLGRSSVTMTEGTVIGNLYGGANAGVVRGGCEVDIRGGTVKGSAFGGGQGQAGHQSTYGSRKFRMSDARVENSVYGGSSYGNDGTGTFDSGRWTITLDSSVTVIIGSGYIGGSVYGGGYEGVTAGSTAVWIGYNDVASPGASGSIHIGLSVYGSGDVGNITAGQVGYTQYLVLGKADVHFNGKGYDISFSGGILGSGNSCLTYGESAIEIVDVKLDNKIDAIHRADKATIKSSSLKLNGRSAGNGENENVGYSIYDIGELEVIGGTSLYLYAPMDNIGSYASRNVNGDLTTYSSPSNSIYLCEGTVFEVISTADGNTVYGKIWGYTILTIPTAEAYYGAFAFGNLASEGGFVIANSGSYILADSASFPNCRCWFRSGIAKEVTSVILTYDKDKTGEEIISSTAKVQFKLLSANTDLRYTGGYFEPYEIGMYSLVGNATPGVDQYSVQVGTNSAGTPSRLLNFGDGCFVTNTMTGASVFASAWDGNPLTGVSDPTVEFTVRGPNMDKSMYAGNATLYFQEVSKVTYMDGDGQPKEDYVILVKTEVKINIYREKVGEGIDDNDLNVKTVGGTGSADIMIPRGFRNCDLYLESVEGVKGDYPLTLTMSKNAEANNGWNGSLREYSILTGYESNMFIGQLNGGHNADLRFTISGFTDKAVKTYVFNFVIKEAGGAVKQTFKTTISVSQMDPLLITFHDAKQGFERIMQFEYGTKISTANCPTTLDNFVGWYIDEDFINPFNFNNALASNMNLYACYKHVVTFDNGNGTYSTLQVPLQDGGTLISPPAADPTWHGYTFAGWYKDSNCDIQWSFDRDRVVDDITLYAKWEGERYDLVFRYKDPTDQDIKDVNIGDQLTEEEKAWLKVTYGGRFGPIVDRATDYFEDNILPGIDGGKYKFVRWQLQADSVYVGIYSDTVVSGDGFSGNTLVLYADIASDAISVHLNPNTEDQTAIVSNPIAFLVYKDSEGNYSFMSNNATRVGYQLVGWSKIPGATTADEYKAMGSEWKIPASEVVSGYTLELYAVWEKNTYEIIIFAPDGGKIDAYHAGVRKEVFNLGYGEQIDLNYTVGDGYLFSNWHISGEGRIDDVYSPNTSLKVTGNCAVYAQLRGLEQVTVNVTVDGAYAPDGLVLHLSSDGQNSYRKFAHTDRSEEKDGNTYRTFILSSKLGEFRLCLERYGGEFYVLQTVNITADGKNTYWVELVSIDTAGVTGAEHLRDVPRFMLPGSEVTIGFEEGYHSAEGLKVAFGSGSPVAITDNRFTVPADVSSGPVHITGAVSKITYKIKFDTSSSVGLAVEPGYGDVCNEIPDMVIEHGGTYPALPVPAIGDMELLGGTGAGSNLTGIKWVGWFSDTGYQLEVKEGDAFPNTEITLYAKIVPQANVECRIWVYMMGTDGKYSDAPTKITTGTGPNSTAADFNAETYPHAGFTYNPGKSDVGKLILDGTKPAEEQIFHAYFDRMFVENPRIYLGTETASLEGWSFIESSEGNGNYLTKDRVYYGEIVILPAVTKVGHTTVWKLDGLDHGQLTYTPALDGNRLPFGELVAHYTINTYTLTLITPFGTLSNGAQRMTVSLTYGDKVEVSNPVPDEAHAFVKWDKAVPETMPAEDYTLTALWKGNTYILTFKGNEHVKITTDVDGLSSGDLVEHGKQLTLTLVVDDGYVLKSHTPEIGEFKKVNDNRYTWSLTVKGKLDLYATSERLTYSIHYIVDGVEQKDTMCQNGIVPGTVFPPLVDYGKVGYTFDGWYADADFKARFSAPEKVERNYSLYGKTTPVTYDIAFHSNGADGSMGNMSLKYDESKALTALGFSKEGYRFLGWATSGNGEVVYSNEAEVTNLRNTPGTVDLYAVWYIERPYAGIYDGADHASLVEIIGRGQVYYSTDGPIGGSDYSGHTITPISHSNAADIITVYYFVRSGEVTAAGSMTFSITPKSLTSGMIEVGGFMYDGEKKTVAVTVRDGETVLSGGQYTVGGAVEGTDAREYDITVTGTGNYKDSVPMKWNIARLDIKDAKITLGPALTYNGEVQTQTITSVKIGEMAVTYEGPTGNSGKNAESYVLSVSGTGNFTGTATQGWSIAKLDISDAKITLGPALTYNGDEQTQTIASVKIGDLPVDTYGVSEDRKKDADSYTLTVSGTGNFTGTATQSWSIAKKAVTVIIKGHTATKTYTGSELSVEGFDIFCDGETLFDEDKVVHKGSSKAFGTNVGVYENMGLVEDQFSYGDGNLDVTFEVTDGKLTVNAKPLEDSMISVTGTYVYDGTSKNVAFTVTYGTLTLQKGTDFNIVKDGEGTVAGGYVLTIGGIGNYSGTAEGEWRIDPKEIDVPEVKTGLIYNGTVQKIVADSGDYTVEGVTKDAGTGKSARLVLNDKDNTIWKGGNSEDRSVTYAIAPKPLENGMIKVIGDYVYVPGGQSVDFTVKDGDYELVRNTDYRIDEGGSSSGPGSYVLKITGLGNYKGPAEVGWSVGLKEIPVPQPVTGTVYDGSLHECVRGGTGYTVEGGSAVDAGEHTAKLTLQTGYAWKGGNTHAIEVKYIIAPKPLAESGVTADGPFTYNADEQTVTVTVKDGNETLRSGIDYTVTGDLRKTAAGTYKVTVEGSGNYSGTFERQWTIKKMDISAATVTIKDLTFNGVSQVPNVVLALSGFTDVTFDMVAGAAGTDADTYTMDIRGTGNFMGSVEKEWRILPRELSSDMIQITGKYTFTGDSQDVKFNVRYGGSVLVEGRDYSVIDKSGKNAGDHTLEIRGMNNYTGPATESWNIAPKEITISVIGNSGSKTYTGSELSLEGYKATCASEPLFDEKAVVYDGTPKAVGTTVGSYPMNLDVSRFTYGDGNFKASFTVTDGKLTVDAKPLEDSMISVTGTYVYDGTSKDAAFTVTYGTLTLQKGNDFKIVENGKGTDAGGYALKIEGIGNYSGTATATWTIAPKEIDVPEVKTGLIYNGTVQDILDSSADYTVTGVTGSAGVGKAATLVLKDRKNTVWADTGNSEDHPITYSIAKRELTEGMVSVVGGGIYTGDEQAATVFVRDGSRITGSDYNITGERTAVTAGTHNVIVTATENGNYFGEVIKSWYISPATVTKPVLGTKEYNGQIQKADIPSEIGDISTTVTNGGGRDVGSYGVEITLDGNHLWDDGERTASFVFEITKKILKITAEDKKKTFHDADPELTYLVDGLVFGDSRDVIRGELERSPGKDVGVYTISRGTLEADNYDIKFFAGKLTIDPSGVKVSQMEFGPKIYNGENQKADVPTGDWTVIRNEGGTDVGSYEVVIRLQPNHVWEDSGLATDRTLQFKIVKASLTVTVSKDDYQFSDEPSVPTVTGNNGLGYVFEYAPVGTEDFTRTVPTKVGEYTVKVIVPESRNYLGTSAVDGFSIVPKKVDVPGPKTGLVYNRSVQYGVADGIGYTVDQPATDAGDHSASVTLREGYVWSDGSTDVRYVDFSIARKAFTEDMVVNWEVVRQYTGDEVCYAIYVKDEGGFLKNNRDYVKTGELCATTLGEHTVKFTGLGNYEGEVEKKYYLINETVIRAPASSEFVYDGTPKNGVNAPEGCGYKIVSGGSALDAGTYRAVLRLVDPVNTKWSLSGSVEDITVEYIIRKASFIPAVTVDGWTFGESGKCPKVFGNTSNGDITFTYAVKGTDPEHFTDVLPEAAGTYILKLSVAETDNYEAATATCEFTISQKTLGIGMVDFDREYAYVGELYTVDGSDGTLFLKLTDASCELESGIDYKVVSGGSGRDAGDYVMVIKGIGNYAGTVEVPWKIDTAVLHITAVDAEKTYGEDDPELTYYVVEGLIGEDINCGMGNVNDNVLTGSVERVSGADVGRYAILQGSLSARNYDIVFEKGVFEILPAKVTEPVDMVLTKTYSGELQRADIPAGIWDVVNEGGTDVGGYEVVLTLDGNHIWSVSGGHEYRQIFTVTPATLTITVGDVAILKGDVPAYTFTVDGLMGGDTLGGLGITVTPGCDYGSVDAGGSCPIGATVSGSSDNYNWVIVPGTLTVTAPCSVDADIHVDADLAEGGNVHATGIPESGRVAEHSALYVFLYAEGFAPSDADLRVTVTMGGTALEGAFIPGKNVDLSRLPAGVDPSSVLGAVRIDDVVADVSISVSASRPTPVDSGWDMGDPFLWLFVAAVIAEIIIFLAVNLRNPQMSALRRYFTETDGSVPYAEVAAYMQTYDVPPEYLDGMLDELVEKGRITEGPEKTYARK